MSLLSVVSGFVDGIVFDVWNCVLNVLFVLLLNDMVVWFGCWVVWCVKSCMMLFIVLLLNDVVVGLEIILMCLNVLVGRLVYGVMLVVGELIWMLLMNMVIWFVDELWMLIDVDELGLLFCVMVMFGCVVSVCVMFGLVGDSWLRLLCVSIWVDV